MLKFIFYFISVNYVMHNNCNAINENDKNNNEINDSNNKINNTNIDDKHITNNNKIITTLNKNYITNLHIDINSLIKYTSFNQLHNIIDIKNDKIINGLNLNSLTFNQANKEKFCFLIELNENFEKTPELITQIESDNVKNDTENNHFGNEYVENEHIKNSHLETSNINVQKLFIKNNNNNQKNQYKQKPYSCNFNNTIQLTQYTINHKKVVLRLTFNNKQNKNYHITHKRFENFNKIFYIKNHKIFSSYLLKHVHSDESYITIDFIINCKKNIKCIQQSFTNKNIELIFIHKPNKKLILIDPGHGGTDYGHANYKANIIEKNFNLQIATEFMQYILQNAGEFYDVILTRVNDINLSQSQRFIFIKNIMPDIVFSFHSGYSHNIKKSGLEIYNTDINFFNSFDDLQHYYNLKNEYNTDCNLRQKYNKIFDYEILYNNLLSKNLKSKNTRYISPKYFFSNPKSDLLIKILKKNEKLQSCIKLKTFKKNNQFFSNLDTSHAIEMDIVNQQIPQETITMIDTDTPCTVLHHKNKIAYFLIFYAFFSNKYSVKKIQQHIHREKIYSLLLNSLNEYFLIKLTT